MLRLAGAAMLLTASAALGFGAAGTLRARVNELEGLILSLKTMEWELSDRLTPLPELIRRSIACMNGVVKDFYLLCLYGLENRKEILFSSIWREAAESVPFHLDEHELSQLVDVGNILGRYDAASQCAALRESRARLNELLDHARGQKERLGRVYSTMGLTSGALLVIVLL